MWEIRFFLIGKPSHAPPCALRRAPWPARSRSPPSERPGYVGWWLGGEEKGTQHSLGTRKTIKNINDFFKGQSAFPRRRKKFFIHLPSSTYACIPFLATGIDHLTCLLRPPSTFLKIPSTCAHACGKGEVGRGRHSPGAISTAAVERRRGGFSSPFLFFLSCLVSVFMCVCEQCAKP